MCEVLQVQEINVPPESFHHKAPRRALFVTSFLLQNPNLLSDTLTFVVIIKDYITGERLRTKGTHSATAASCRTPGNPASKPQSDGGAFIFYVTEVSSILS